MVLPIPARPGRGRPRRWSTYTNNVLPQHIYAQTTTVPFSRSAQTLIASDGTGTVAVGPAGVGTKWYPMTATFSTTSGASDTSRVALYLGFVSEATLLNGQQYHGGADSAGLAIPFMTPGDLIVASWILGDPGDIAQVTIMGTMDVMTT